jgi:hypothetical protein
MVMSFGGGVFAMKLLVSLIVGYKFEKVSPASPIARTGQVLIASQSHALKIVVFHVS